MRLLTEMQAANISQVFDDCAAFVWNVADDTLSWSDGMGILLTEGTPPATLPELISLIQPEDRTRFERFVHAEPRKGHARAQEFHVVEPDGTGRVVNLRIRAAKAETGSERLVQGLVLDVTMTRSAQDNSTTGPARASHGIGRFRYDVAEQVAFWSLGMFHLFDMPPSPVVNPGKEALARVHPDDRDDLQALVNQVSRRIGPYETTYRVIMRDGSRRHILDRGEAIGPIDDKTGLASEVHGVLIDVTRQIGVDRAPQADRQTLHDLIETAPVGAYLTDADLRITQANPVARKMLAPLDPVAGRNLDDVLHHMWPAPVATEMLSRFQHTLETGEPFHSAPLTEETGALDAPLGFDLTLRRIAMPDGRNGVICYFQDLARLTRETATLRQDAHDFQTIIDNAVAFIAILETDGTLTDVNAPALIAGGLTRDDVVAKKFWDAAWWNYDAGVADRVRDAIATASGGEVVRYDADVRMRGESIMSIDFMLSPIVDADGTVIRLVASGFDITDRKQSEDYVRLLMEEINHRSKNVLNLVQSIARLTRNSEPENFLERFEARLGALAASYDLLVAGANSGVELRALVRTQLAHVSDLAESRLVLDGPDMKITPEAAQGLGIAIHELATNAAKYGSLSNATGTVDISWKPLATEFGEDSFEITWTERGGPPVTAPEKTGFGSTVLGPMAQSALNGEVHHRYEPTGVIWYARGGSGCLVD